MRYDASLYITLQKTLYVQWGAAAIGLHVPYQRWLNSGARVRGSSASLDTEIGTSMNYVTPGYFEVLRIPLRSGRVFNERDTEDSMPVALVNETFARKFLKGQDALTSYIVGGKVTRQIVGVVSDLQQQPGLSRSGPIVQEPALYIPATQFSSDAFRMAHTWYSPNWVVRATGRRQEIARGMERAISAADPLLPVASFRSMLDERDSALKSQRVNAWLLGTLAALALSLALVGVYGMVANSVVETIDTPTFLTMASALIVISALASLIPALRLVRLAPASVLRQD